MGHIEEERVDEVVRQVVQAAYPVRDLPVPPPRATPAELRARAEARRAGHPATRLREWAARAGRWALPVAAGTTVVVVVVLGAIGAGHLTGGVAEDETPATGSSHMVPTSAPGDTPSPLVLSTVGDPSATRAHLVALATVAGRARETTGPGAYAYVHVQSWAAGQSRGPARRRATSGCGGPPTGPAGRRPPCCRSRPRPGAYRAGSVHFGHHHHHLQAREGARRG
ncbi:hypothetical protein ACFQ1L_39510 [Phytohabitans flavus]|uniref:hypothetical protein n=1 Tax=Phytohabitans flavus TaxID=1076124 RepID=UPI00362A1FE6